MQTDKSETTGRKCECCGATDAAGRWSVDPEGVELCPQCADEIGPWLAALNTEPTRETRT